MKRLFAVCGVLALCAVLAAPVESRPKPDRGLRPSSDAGDIEAQWPADPGLRALYESAAVDTYCIVWFDFELKDWQGWTRVDETAQLGAFFHVDDFAGLGGGSFGMLAPLEGTKSMWCGARANASDPYLCSWRRAPGYGNYWDQSLQTNAFSFSGAITFSYHLWYDSEPDYDFTYVEYDAGGSHWTQYGDGNWQTIAIYTSDDDTVAEHFLPITQARTKLRFRFFSDGAWSDQDGLYNTDGGCIVDEIRVRDAASLNNYQNFETVAVGATAAGIWTCVPAPGFGSYSGLMTGLQDRDPCGDNLSSQIVFWYGSPNPSPAIPGQYDTPFCAGPGGITAPCQNDWIVSPPIDMTKYSTAWNETQNGIIPPGDLPQLGGCRLVFTVYRDLPLPNLVFYQWSVRTTVGGCPGIWDDLNFVYYGGEQDYLTHVQDLSSFVSGSDPVQIRLGVVDLCDEWYLVNGNCAQHTTAPYFDNVRLYRYRTAGPQWVWRDIDFFQDNFPEDEYLIESPVRADAANDINTNDNPVIRPGDSIVVECASPIGGGIASDPSFGGPAVYLHVKVSDIGPYPHRPNVAGPALAGSVLLDGDPPLYESFNYVSDDGAWTIIQCDTARANWGVAENKYMVDLNDALFTRGYTIEYYFTARDVAGLETSLPRWARSSGPYFEWTCLPTLNTDALFVDDFTGRGSFAGSVENYWTSAFQAVLPPPNCYVDRYDVNGPSSLVSNGPGSRARSFLDRYHMIVWDSGDLSSGTISDGTVYSDKSADCQALVNYLGLTEHSAHLWICGDNVAADLDGSTDASALALMNLWCGVDFLHDSFFRLTGGISGGGIVHPLVSGSSDAGVFMHIGLPDRFYLEGACPVINSFDVLEKTGGGLYALDYPEYQGTTYHAGIARAGTNAGGYNVNTMWFGFSFQAIRDDVVGAPIDRFEIVKDAFQWMNNAVNPNVTGATAPKANRLAQNFPNPFNPSTTIRYDVKAKGLVTIRVFDVSGRLVRTLVEGVKDAGSYSASWDGANNLGARAASGVYFCRMQTGDFEADRKLVLLK